MATTKKAAPKKTVSTNKLSPKAQALEKEGEALNNTILITVYVVDDSANNVTLEVIPGEEGQQSDMDITLDNKVLANKTPDPFPETIIGTNKKLQGKILRIRVVITDVLPDSDVTSLTIILKGGGQDSTFPLGKTVGTNGTADYICRIDFV